MTDLVQKRSNARRQIVKLVIGFAVAIVALLSLYTLKPEVSPNKASLLQATVEAPKPTTAPVTAAVRGPLSSEQLIKQTPPRKQVIDIQSWNTSKGARVMFVEAQEVPMLDIRLVFNAGGARDGDKPGLASMTNAMLNEGTATYSVDDIARHFEGLGAALSLGSYRDMAIVSLRTLSDPVYRDKALPMFYDVVSKPDFPADAFERIRQQMLLGLESEKQNPQATMSRTFYSTLYANHPYGIPPNGTEASLNAMAIEDLKAFHAQYYTAANLVISMTGAIDRAAAEQIVNAIDAQLPAGNAAPQLPEPKDLAANTEQRLAFPSSQTHIVVGNLSVDRRTPDWAALYVGNEILGGGGFVSRLNQIIRQDNGLAYSVYSSVSPMAQEGPFTMGLQTRNENADKALALVRDTFNRFINEGPTPQELDDAKKNILGGLPLSTASNRAIVDQLGAMGFYDLPLDYLETLPVKIAAVTVDDVKRTFATHIGTRKQLTLLLGGEAQGDKALGDKAPSDTAEGNEAPAKTPGE